jgi:hypothetical protein
MTPGNIQAQWQILPNTNIPVLILTKATGEKICLPVDQVNRIINPAVQQPDGSYVFNVNLTDITSEQKQNLYATQTPTLAPDAINMTIGEFSAVLNSVQQMQQTNQAAALSNTQAATGAAMGAAATPANNAISVAGTVTGIAGATRTSAQSLNQGINYSNRLVNGINGIQNASNINGFSNAVGNIASGVSGFNNMTNNGVTAVTATQTTDDRNFFLSIGNWLDNSLFGSIANLMPMDLLKKAIQMMGGCISGLFKTVGYMIEGDWGKVGEVGLNWLKDVAITGGLTYGAYTLAKQLNLFSSEESSNSSSSNSSSSNSGSSSSGGKVTQTTTTVTQTISIGNNTTGNGTPVATLDQAGKIITSGNNKYFSTGTILNNDTKSME